MNKHYLSAFIATLTLTTLTFPAKAQWINQDILADNPRAYCSDIVAGNRASNIVSTQGSSSLSSEEIYHRERGGGGGVSIFGIGANGSGQSTTHRENRNSEQNSSTYYHDFSTITHVTAGQNCDAFVQGAAHVEATRIESDAYVEGQRIQADVNNNLIDSRERVSLRELEVSSQDQLFQMMMQGF